MRVARRSIPCGEILRGVFARPRRAIRTPKERAEGYARGVKAAWGYRDSAQPAENVAGFPFADFDTLLQLREGRAVAFDQRRACDALKEKSSSMQREYNDIKGGKVENQTVGEIGGFVKKLGTKQGLELHSNLAKRWCVYFYFLFPRGQCE